MHRRVLVIAFVGFALASALALFTLSRPEPKRSEPPAARVETPSPPPVVRETKPEPAPAEATPRSPRRAAPKSAPAAAPSPAPAAAEAAADTGVLHINSDVPGAQVFIDRMFVGAAPVTAPNVAPGQHRINVSAPGYDGVAETVDVTPGSRDIVIRLKEVRLDATIAVVHKHRIGSCRGQLIATPQSIRYVTSDKDDGFSVPLRDLETLDVDYLAKNLRVKLQKGKRYDFTDPEGNADRLFVFHRDVEKARDRLKKGDPPAGQ